LYLDRAQQLGCFAFGSQLCMFINSVIESPD